jgi:hypothetical protein
MITLHNHALHTKVPKEHPLELLKGRSQGSIVAVQHVPRSNSGSSSSSADSSSSMAVDVTDTAVSDTAVSDTAVSEGAVTDDDVGAGESGCRGKRKRKHSQHKHHKLSKHISTHEQHGVELMMAESLNACGWTKVRELLDTNCCLHYNTAATADTQLYGCC